MKLIPNAQLPASEHEDARRYWAERGLRKSYTQMLPYRRFIAERVVAEHPKRVLEFGCNVGLNLSTIRTLDPSIVLTGVDINPVALAWGRDRYKLPLTRAVPDGAAWLAHRPDDDYDVAYTVSVLDHIAKPAETLTQLARVAKTLLLLEPWFGREGKVPQEDVPGTAPFSYSWNYPMRLGRLGFTVEKEPYALNADPRTLGPNYVLYTCRRKALEEPIPEPEPVPPVPEPEPVPVPEPEPEPVA